MEREFCKEEKEKKLILKWISYAVLSTNCHKDREDTQTTWVFYSVVLRCVPSSSSFLFVVAVLPLQIMRNHLEIERMTACPRNIATVTGPRPLSHPVSLLQLLLAIMTLVSTKLASHGNDHVLCPAPLPTLHSNNKTGKTGKTNKTKVSSYFGLFFSFIYFLLASFFLPFYVKSPQWAVERGGGDTHMCPSLSGPICLAAGQFETCAKRQEEGQLSVPQPCISLPLPTPPPLLSSLLFVARVRDLLNL